MACRLDGTKPLSKPVLEYCCLHHWKQTSVKYWSKFEYFLLRNAMKNVVWKMAANLSRSQCVNLYGLDWFSGNDKIYISFDISCRCLQYIPRHMHRVFALLCFVVVIHWLIFPYPSGLLHWHCGNVTIAPVPAKQPRWIWINTSCEFIMNDCHNKTKHNKTVCIFLGIYCRWYSVLGFSSWKTVSLLYFMDDIMLGDPGRQGISSHSFDVILPE